jgi:cytochrome c oxidase subunit 2
MHLESDSDTTRKVHQRDEHPHLDRHLPIKEAPGRKVRAVKRQRYWLLAVRNSERPAHQPCSRSRQMTRFGCRNALFPRQSSERAMTGPRVPRTVLLLALAILTTGCDSKDLSRLGLQPPATKQGQVVVTLWQGSWVAALLVGAVVWGAISWAVIFYRQRGDRVPSQVRYNLPLEIVYTVLPFIMVGVLFYFTARDENYIDKLSAHPDVVVNVIGFQWSWEFQYPQYRAGSPKNMNGVKGATNVVTELGAMWNPNQYSNHQRLPVLEIPEHKTVRFNLVSLDVVHSFWIVPFEFKRDVIPGHPNHFEVTPTRTGTWTGRCSEFCGLYHSRMLFTVKIVTPAQFKQWIKTQQMLQNASGGTQ